MSKNFGTVNYKRNAPSTFGVNQVIKGWTEGLQLMSIGDKVEFYIPYAFHSPIAPPQSFSTHRLSFSWNLAYGAAGRPPTIPKYSSLVFVVELFEINGKSEL